MPNRVQKNRPNNMSALKKRWMLKNPPDANGNYECWICELPVSASKMTIDHVAPVHLYPEYARDLSNMRPAHQWCNEQRGQPEHSRLITRFGSSKSKRRRGNTTFGRRK